MKKQENRMNTIKKREVNEKELFLKEFKDKMGNVSASCEAIGICRGQYYKWRRDDKEFASKCDDIIYAVHEVAESRLIKNILEGKETSLIFYLCNRMPERWKNVQRVEQRFDNTTEGKIDQLLSFLGQALKNGKKKESKD